MGIKERRERERQDLRQKILDASCVLFAERGYEAVTMREIAKRIEYSATVLYKHFADKETLVRELCRQNFAVLAQRFIDAVSSGDALERFARAGLVYLDFAAESPEHYRLMFMGELPPTPPEQGERDDPSRNAYVFVRSLTAELLHQGLLREDLTDADLVAQTVWAGVHGAAALELTLANAADWVDFKSRRERFAAVLEVVARGVARDPEAAASSLRRVLGAQPVPLGAPNRKLRKAAR